MRAVSSLSSTGRVGSLLGVALLAFVAGYLGGAVRDSSDETPTAVAAAGAEGASHLAARLADLEERLHVEESGRRTLTAKIERLQEQLASTAVREAGGTQASPGPGSSGAESRGAGTDGVAARPAHPGAADASSLDGPDESVLLAAGFHRSEVEAYRERVAEIEMERLYLADRAAREGWARTPRFRNERQALNDEMLGMREEFGDELYDWALYASGQPNRIQVASVIGGSPAQLAGIQKGDVIVSYDGARVLGNQDLTQQIRQGRAGETTTVDVLRGGEVITVSLPRGPLGVRLQPTTAEPKR